MKQVLDLSFKHAQDAIEVYKKIVTTHGCVFVQGQKPHTCDESEEIIHSYIVKLYFVIFSFFFVVSAFLLIFADCCISVSNCERSFLKK